MTFLKSNLGIRIKFCFLCHYHLFSIFLTFNTDYNRRNLHGLLVPIVFSLTIFIIQDSLTNILS